MQKQNLKLFFLLVIFLILPSFVEAANFPLEIIQPQPGLNTSNRFYKAYPGLVYNVRAAVIGGEYPFTYTLTTYPDGMTVNENTGEINWPNPTTSGSPHPVTLLVTDQENTVSTVSWTITVTTDGFYFIDAINGLTVAQGGTGTQANPWKIIEDWYITKYDTTYSGGFLYFKTGTYTPPALEDGERLAFNQNYKPKIWLAYPDDFPIFDMSYAHISMYAGGGNNFYVDGIDFVPIANPDRKGISIDGASMNVVLRNNKFHGTTERIGTNMAHIFIAANASQPYWAIQDNLFYDSVRTMGIEGYDATKVLVEDNYFYNFSNGGGESHAIGPKSNITRWDIRHNQIWNAAGHGIWIGGSNSNPFENNEVRFNVVKDTPSGYALTVNYDGTDTGTHYIYRNTFVGSIYVRNPIIGMGPYYFYNNVIQNPTDGFTYNTTPDAGVVVSTNNLIETSGLVDSSGNLIDPYLDYVGTTGWQIGESDVIPPSSPTGMSIL
ncbi:MAG: putative Ig domain-containing protein [Candidatus Moraniibacteriota bacterium]